MFIVIAEGGSMLIEVTTDLAVVNNCTYPQLRLAIDNYLFLYRMYIYKLLIQDGFQPFWGKILDWNCDLKVTILADHSLPYVQKLQKERNTPQLADWSDTIDRLATDGLRRREEAKAYHSHIMNCYPNFAVLPALTISKKAVSKTNHQDGSRKKLVHETQPVE